MSQLALSVCLFFSLFLSLELRFNFHPIIISRYRIMLENCALALPYIVGYRFKMISFFQFFSHYSYIYYKMYVGTVMIIIIRLHRLVIQ